MEVCASRYGFVVYLFIRILKIYIKYTLVDQELWILLHWFQVLVLYATQIFGVFYIVLHLIETSLEKFEHVCYLSTLICGILYLHSHLGSMSILISQKFQNNTLWMDSHISSILYRRSRSMHATWRREHFLLASILYVVRETLDIFCPRLLSMHTTARRANSLHFTLLLNLRNVSLICFYVILMLLGSNA